MDENRVFDGQLRLLRKPIPILAHELLRLLADLFSSFSQIMTGPMEQTGEVRILHRPMEVVMNQGPDPEPQVLCLESFIQARAIVRESFLVKNFQQRFLALKMIIDTSDACLRLLFQSGNGKSADTTREIKLGGRFHKPATA